LTCDPRSGIRMICGEGKRCCKFRRRSISEATVRPFVIVFVAPAADFAPCRP
jgi:hypothetical protein